MKNLILISFLFLFPLYFYASTGNDLSQRIKIDGFDNDYTSDESLLHPGNSILESDHDSFWGKENEVIDIKTTWDSKALYIYVNGVLNGNNLMFFLDYKDGGIPDFNPSNSYNTISWKRSLSFIEYYPDIYIGTWENNENPLIYVASSSNGDYQIAQSTATCYAKAHLPTGIKGGMEIMINWNYLYSMGNGNVPPNSVIRLAVCITNGGFGIASSPDVAPDNSSGTSSDGQTRVFIDNFIELHVDFNGDGVVDINVSPVLHRNFTKSYSLPHKPENILIKKFTVNTKIAKLNGEVNSFKIESIVNIPALYNLEVFNLNGKKVKTIFYHKLLGGDLPYTINWNCKDDDQNLLPPGYYILQLTNSDKTVNKKIAIGIVK